MSKCKIVAEIGINHNGDMKIAQELIDVAANANCDYVKFQKRTIDLVYTPEELATPRENPFGPTNGDLKRGLEFDKEEYQEITEYCESRDIGWFASPWDVESVKVLKDLNVPYMKVASAMLTDFDILEEMRFTNIPVILSTGMSTYEEVNAAVKYFGPQIAYILACTATYPTPPEESNINFIKTLKMDYPDYKIGFSNHSPGLTNMIAAAALGIEMLEFHITLDRSMFGSDQSASIEPEGTRKIVKHVRHLETAMGDGEWTVFPSEVPIKAKLRKK